MTDTSKTKPARRFARTPKSQTPADGAAGTMPDPEVPGRTDEQPVAARRPKPDSKIARVIMLLRRAEGATIEEMIAVTGWLPHTTRAALTGLKKKGHTITRHKRDDVTCYSIGEAG